MITKGKEEGYLEKKKYNEEEDRYNES